MILWLMVILKEKWISGYVLIFIYVIIYHIIWIIINIKTELNENIEIKYIDSDKGRGIFTTNDIEKDTIILEEPALLYETNKYHKIFGIKATDMNNDRISVYSDLLYNLRFEILNTLMIGSDVDAYKISILFKGNTSNLIIPDLNIFTNESIPINSYINLSDINIECISNIIKHNCFQIPTNISTNKNGTGLFILSSLFNHSFKPNISRQYKWISNNINEYPMISFKTITNIPKNTELTHDYGLNPSKTSQLIW